MESTWSSERDVALETSAQTSVLERLNALEGIVAVLQAEVEAVNVFLEEDESERTSYEGSPERTA